MTVDDPKRSHAEGLAGGLDAALRDPGFTPGAKLVPELLRRLEAADEDAAVRLVAALCAVQTPFVARRRAAIEALPDARLKPLLRGLAARGEKVDGDAVGDLLGALLAGSRAALHVAAIRGLARLGGAAARGQLEAARAHALAPPAARALTIALAELGDEAAGRAARGAGGTDPRAARAALIGLREQARAVPSRVRPDVPLGAGARVALTCRAGLEEILAAEIAERGLARARALAPGPARVELEWSDALAPLSAARVALEVALVETHPRAAGASEVDAAFVALTSRTLRARLRALTEGPVRFRVAWADGGRRRGETWELARRVAALGDPDLVNDPRASAWELVLDVSARGCRVEARPALPDTRFAYRVADVPAASHPTIAAALARAGEARPDDVVWDPFVGSGLELCERARLGPYQRLCGSDRDPSALEKAGANLRSAGVTRFELARADARRARLDGLTLVITNPPMGRRVLAGHDLEGLLAATLRNAAAQLSAGGRVVLVSPVPGATARVLRELGFDRRIDRRVDLGGFSATLQRWDKPG